METGQFKTPRWLPGGTAAYTYRVASVAVLDGLLFGVDTAGSMLFYVRVRFYSFCVTSPKQKERLRKR